MIGQARSRRGPGDRRAPRGKSGEGERRERTRMPRTLLCTVRAQREGEGGGTQPEQRGGRGQAGGQRGEQVPRKLLCIVRVRQREERAREEQRVQTKGEEKRKGAREGTGTEGMPCSV